MPHIWVLLMVRERIKGESFCSLALFNYIGALSFYILSLALFGNILHMVCTINDINYLIHLFCNYFKSNHNHILSLNSK